MKHGASFVVAFVTATALAGAAHAQGDPAAAQFDIGLQAMKQEKWDTACPAFAESYRLDPRAGVVFTLAECEAKWGKLASALGHYQAYLDAYAKMKPDEQARQGRRVEIAQSQKQSLEQDVPRLTITLASAAPAGASVVLDGVAVDRARLGTAIALDPGEHVVVLHLPDGSADRRPVTIAVHERRTLELAPQTSATPSGAEANATSADRGDAGDRAKKPSPVPIFVAAGIGVVAVGIGAVTGLLAAGKKDTIDQHCIDTRCDTTGKQAADDAKSLATISTIAFGVGIAAGATAIVLVLLSPSSAPASKSARGLEPRFAVGPDGATGGVAGSF